MATQKYITPNVKSIANQNKNGNESGRTCEGGAKRPPVGSFTCFVFGFVFVLISVKFVFSFFFATDGTVTTFGM